MFTKERSYLVSPSQSQLVQQPEHADYSFVQTFE